MLILDEPTSSLDADEVAELFRVMRRLRDGGAAILFVSHFLDQVYDISDRMTVLRNGRLVGEYPTAALDRVQLIAAMLGHDSTCWRRSADTAASDSVATDADGAAAPWHRSQAAPCAPMDLDVHRGEVVGLAGLLGSGRTELARLLFGADRATSGRMLVNGKPDAVRSPRAAIAKGFAFSSEDRKAEGIIGELTVRDNLVLALQARRGFARQLSKKAKDELVGSLHGGPRHPAARPGGAGEEPQRRQPAEGVAGPVADHRTAAVHPRRTHPGHRRRRQGADPEARRRPGGRTAWAWCSSPPNSTRWRRISDRIAVLRDGHCVAQVGSDCTVKELTALIAAGGTR